MRNASFFITVSWMVLVLTLVWSPHTRASGDSVAARRIRMHRLADATIAQYASDVLSEGGVPGGVVSVEQGAAEPRYVFPEIDGTVGEILDAAVRVDAAYEWDNVDGVINVAPRGRRTPLLDCVVKHAEIGNQPGADVVGEILALPEVEACGTRNGLKPGFRFLYPRSCKWKPSRPLTFEGVTVREVLNALVSKEGTCHWRYREWMQDGSVAYAIE